MTNDELYNELNSELDVIYDEVSSLRVDQHIFWELQEIIRANPTINVASEFYLWMGRAYAASMSAAIRRQVDERRDTVSFVRFLRRLARQPGVITRERYKSLSTTAPEDYMDADFDRLVGIGTDTISSTEIQKEIEGLISKADVLKKYTDSIIAHCGKTRPTIIPTFRDVDEAIEVLEKLLKRYFVLFRAIGLSGALPAIVYDWKAIFRVPWIGSGKG
jgi:AbiU2